MCTATYLPLISSGFILTHSRDEKAIRPAALPPRTVNLNGKTLTYPQDPQGQGTWIATTGHTTVCLLNGAFVPHLPQPPYKHSRGLVIPHYSCYSSINAFTESYDFTGIEPFTLLVAEVGRLAEIRWNGRRLFTHEKDPSRPYIWSSVTLYPPDVIKKREGWFRDWQHEHPMPSVKAIRWFHQTAGDGDPANSLRMNRRNTLLTLSLTSVVHEEKGIEIVYEDFIQQTHYRQFINPSAYATS